MTGKTHRYAATVLLLGLIAAAGCSKEEAAKPSAENRTVSVTTQKVAQKTMRKELLYTATIEAWETCGIVPNISGKIQRILVDAGDRVKKGQLLARLDTESLELSREQAKANLNTAEANCKDAERNFLRMDELIRDKTISPQQHEKAELAFDIARAQLEQAKTALDLVEYNIRVSSMNAPFDGVIARKIMDEGDMINPSMGGKPVLTLIEIATVKARILVPDTDLRYIVTGLPVTITVDAYPDEVFEGVVHIVPPATTDNSRLFEVEIKIPNKNLKLKDGMFARASILAFEHADAMVVPLSSVIVSGEESYVFVLEGTTARKRAVKTGIADSRTVEILSGLVNDDTVIVMGQDTLEDGSTVVVEGGNAQ